MWLIFLWGAAVPFFMAIDDEVRPASWQEGLGTALGLLVLVLIVMMFAPRFAGMWAMGFVAGSALALIIVPIKGYPMLDIGFGVQAVGAWGLMALSPVIFERKQERAMRNHPLAVMQRQAVEAAVASALGGALTARGEAYPMLTTTPEMVGPGRATVESGGPLVFTLDSSGRSHRIERRFIKSVEPVEDLGSPPGTLMIYFTPPILIFGIAVTPPDEHREKWLALASSTNSAS
ncbi:hypothetical protein SAMN05428945_1176 [Streptomyces sp. 2224.1]|nr:hypothetical protein SAMN05428945_1176 [Streptomyces sp. 2224.1]